MTSLKAWSDSDVKPWSDSKAWSDSDVTEGVE